MGLLQVATKQRSAAKIGLFGAGGSGKSLTATLIAIALSKTYHNGAPIAMHDTEGASDWLLDIYAAEGVELRRHRSRAFTDMRQIEKEARDGGCCAFISDSYSHPWADLQESLKKRLRVQRLEFHHMQELQSLWQEWVVQMVNSPLHCIMAGRLAYEWENERDEETGKMGFQKAGTKMRSEKDAGYEPDLLIELEAHRVMEQDVQRGRKTVKQQLKAGGHFLHRLHVLKDRSRALNGKMIEFIDINNYKAGGWKPTYQALAPHFEKLTVGGEHKALDTARTSESLFSDRGDSAYQQRVKRVQIVLEEIQGTLVKLWPGQDAKSKALKQLSIETLFGTRSWTAVESMSLEKLDAALDALSAFEEKVEDGGQADAATEPAACVALLTTCRDKVADAAKVAAETIGIL